MSNSVVFENNSINVKTSMKDVALAFLEEAGGEIESQTKRNCAVVTGQTKNSFQHQVDQSELVCSIGSDYENAIWEEFGTGIYALNGDGRKDVPWFYYDSKGEGHQTSGKKPKRMLWNAYNSLKATIQRIAESRFGEL